MNKKEKKLLVELIAGWEWTQGGSSSEASAYGKVSYDLLKTFGIDDNDPDLRSERCYQVIQLYKNKREGSAISRNYFQTAPWVPELSTDNDFFAIFWEQLEEVYEEDGYRGLIDKIDTNEKGFMEEIRQKSLKEYREEYDKDPNDL